MSIPNLVETTGIAQVVIDLLLWMLLFIPINKVVMGILEATRNAVGTVERPNINALRDTPSAVSLREGQTACAYSPLLEKQCARQRVPTEASCQPLMAKGNGFNMAKTSHRLAHQCDEVSWQSQALILCVAPF
jgi:hypothetical protein